MLFFLTFTFLLPIYTPEVEIPALTDEHTISSVTSNDFKGRIDPRLNDIVQEENAPAPRLKMEIPENQSGQEDEGSDMLSSSSDIDSRQPQEPRSIMPWERTDSNYNMNIKTYEEEQEEKTFRNQEKQPSGSAANQLKTANLSTILSRSMPLPQRSRPIPMAKVILGGYPTPMQARLVSDTLIEMDLNVAPFIKEKDGQYILQVGSFSDPDKANSLAEELRKKSFNARVVYE